MELLEENVSLVKGIFVVYGFDLPIQSGFNPRELIKLKNKTQVQRFVERKMVHFRRFHVI